MTKLPRVSGRECVRAFERVGFYFKRQVGSHVILRRDDPFCQVVVPNHRELDRGTLRAIIQSAGLSADEFVKLL
jgi:predicted RNA binding protein YcfA (HicA-like mRNA interferase family)